MSKPINVEAQRVHRVIGDTVSRLGVLGLLNQEFFEEIRKKDEADIISHFGSATGKLLIKHAILEEKFNTVCVEDGVKMTPLTDEFISEDARQCALDLRVTCTKLVRTFFTQENQLKLKSFEHKSAEFAAFQDSFQRLQTLMDTKLNTPLEEVNSIRENLKHLQSKTQNLKDLRDTKKDAFLKYCEECSKSKEQRKISIDFLKSQVGNEKNNRQQLINEANEAGARDEELLKQTHAQTLESLEKQIRQLDQELKKVLKQNGDDEAVLRKEFKKAANEFDNNMKAYDVDVTNQTMDNQKCQAEFDDTNADLSQIKEEYDMRLEEKRKRDEMAAIMQRKNDEQSAVMDKLERASEFIQAHWRGLLARKEMEKLRKKKKGKRKKK